MKTKIFLAFFLMDFFMAFSSNTGYIDQNMVFDSFLNKVKAYLPINLILNSVEQYQASSTEIVYELESCMLNLKGDVHFENKALFEIHQKNCLNNFLDFYSQFIIIRDILSKFFVENCPEELTPVCRDFLDEMEEVMNKIIDCNERFIEMLIKTDSTMESLSKNFNSIKPENIKRVVMNSILILNKENFYTQLNQVLEKKSEDLVMAKVNEDQGEEVQNKEELKEIKRINGTYFYDNGMKDDPFMNPEHYFLKTTDYVPLDDLHIVFKQDDNASDLIK